MADKIELIKTKMPQTYRMIQDMAKEVGNDAYVWVKQGLRGSPNRFYAFEAGHIVGTPFSLPEVNADRAVLMVRFGVAACCIWPEEAISGAH